VDGVLFLNVGSVGKPKDGDWRACYAVLEPAAAQPVQFVRLEYDIQTVTTAIRQSELPDAFADDLEHGGAPAKIQH
jgi:diadenosine tetraphosphatase ApaH/serine/threonine PP2A family protein phosphatase